MYRVSDPRTIQFKSNTILCMFSGGYDSTAMLHKLLNDVEYSAFNIHAHHINIINKENRNTAESIASNSIFDYYKSAGKVFDVSYSTIQIPGTSNRFLMDSHITLFTAGALAAASPNIVNVAIGINKTDDIVGHDGRSQISRKIYDALTTTPRIYPVRHLIKQEIIDILPAELRSMVWYCRTPQYVNAMRITCNTCNTCKMIQKLTI